MNEYQAVWDARYDKMNQGEIRPAAEPWFEHWIGLVPSSGYRRALDVGCGTGHNSRLLLEQGFEVTAIDISQRALVLCRVEAQPSHTVRVDIRKGIPFGNQRFEFVLADLSLHYFNWNTTARILKDIANCIVPEGIFAGRFNSINDVKYKAGSGFSANGDPNLMINGGIQKRFFSRKCFDNLFGPLWVLTAMEEKTILRFGTPKVFWEVAAIKRSGKNPDS